MTGTLWTIIVAGGTGSRFAGALPKQFCRIGGKPMLMHTISSVRRAFPGSGIVIAMHSSFMDLWDEVCREFGYVSPIVVEGGATRWESVKKALVAVPADASYVAVHDAARPVLSPEIGRSVAEALERGHQGALPVVAVTDSLRVVTEEGSKAVDRSAYRAVQTPQVFRAGLLRDAYSRPYQSSFTDDASVMEAAGFTDIELVEGDSQNIKVTNPGDDKIAEMYLS